MLLIEGGIIVNAKRTPRAAMLWQRSDCRAYNDDNPHITRKQDSIERPSSAPDLATTKLRNDFS
ncbi:hypothetical protein AA0488_1606 [Kozakia baliensis NRIC 0488]|nr:hypothetical protein AA0488_1606 [Kozakia baliensis NRIC 0488]GEL63485.1 hypothetical protein KBA01_07710 [Kozakia baliensis]